MCIAILNKAGKVLEQNILANCWDSNPQGAGLAWVENIGTDKAKVCTYSTLTEQELYDTYKMVRAQHPDSNIMIHFRITTHGGTNIFNTHPFWVHEDHLALIHNGIITGYGDRVSGGKSDTNEFATEVLSRLPFGWEQDVKVRQLVADAIGFSNKIVLLNSNNQYFILNESRGHWNDALGCWFSNDGYKQSEWAWHGNQKVYRGKGTGTATTYKGSTGKKYGAGADTDDFWEGYTKSTYDYINSPEYVFATNEMLMSLLDTNWKALTQKDFNELEAAISEDEKMKEGTYKTRKYKEFLGPLYQDPENISTKILIQQSSLGGVIRKILVSEFHPKSAEIVRFINLNTASSVSKGWRTIESLLIDEDMVNGLMKSKNIDWWIYYQEMMGNIDKHIASIKKTNPKWADTLTKRIEKVKSLFVYVTPADIAAYNEKEEAKAEAKASAKKKPDTATVAVAENAADSCDEESCPNCDAKGDLVFNEAEGAIECQACGATFTPSV